MQTGSIESMVLERREDRRAEVLEAAWISRVEAPIPTGGRYLRPAGDVVSLDGSTPITALLPRLDGPAHDLVLTCIARGARVYAVVPRGADVTGLLTTPNVLVRTVDSVPCAAVADAGSAWVWCGPRESTHWRLELVAAQREALRALFLRLFWTGARAEHWLGADGIERQDPAAPPFDLPAPDGSAPIRREPVGTWPSADAVLVHSVDPCLPTGTPARLWIPASGDQDGLVALRESGVDVVSDGLLLPDLEVREGSGRLVLRADGVPLQIDLSPAQIRDAERVLRGTPTWTFATDVCLGEHEDARLWLRGERQARPPTAEQHIEVGALDVEDLRALPATTPRRFPRPGPLALAVRYSWRVDPPRLPRRAGADPLVKQWSNVWDDQTARVRRLRARLGEAERRQETIRGTFARLAALAGFGRDRTALAAEVDALDGVEPTTPGEALEHRGRLADLEARVGKLIGDLDSTEREARLDAAKTEQRAAWTADVAAARAELPGVSAERKALQARIAELQDAIAALPSAKTGKEKPSRAQRDAKAKRRKLGDTLKRARKDDARLLARMEGLQERIAAPFAFTPPPERALRQARSGGRFVPEAPVSAGPPIPEDALPVVGVLRALRSQRYLVITRWDQLDVGETEARRLNARLVAPEGSP